MFEDNFYNVNFKTVKLANNNENELLRTQNHSFPVNWHCDYPLYRRNITKFQPTTKKTIKFKRILLPFHENKPHSFPRVLQIQMGRYLTFLSK